MNLGRAALARELAGPALISLVALALLWKSREIGMPANLEGISPAFWPKMALLGILAGAGIKSAEVLLRSRAAKEPIEETHEGVSPVRAGIAIALCLVTVVLIDAIGFALANFIFLLAFLRVAGLKSNISSGITALVATIAMLYIFVKLVYVPLPRGWGAFEDSTIALYRLLGIF